MFGRHRQAVLGRPVASVIAPQRHRAGHEAALRSLGAGGDARMMG